MSEVTVNSHSDSPQCHTPCGELAGYGAGCNLQLSSSPILQKKSSKKERLVTVTKTLTLRRSAATIIKTSTTRKRQEKRKIYRPKRTI